MYICLCNGVTDRQVRQAAQAGCTSMSELTMRTGCGASCGSCIPMATGLLDDHHAAARSDVHAPITANRGGRLSEAA